MRTQSMADQVRYPTMTTAQIRDAFLIDALFRPGELHQVHVDLDRAVVGMAAPLRSPIGLIADETLGAKLFTERRELGVLNITTDGVIHVGSESHVLASLDCLYIGQGAKEITFESTNPDSPAVFYLLSYPAHCSYPTTLVRKADASLVELGGAEMCMPGDNARLQVELSKPIAMDEGVRFAIREGGKTVGSGVVTKIAE